MRAAQSATEQVESVGGLPTMSQTTKDAEFSKDMLHALRHFYLGNPLVRKQLEPLEEDFLPALLHPYRDASKLRYEYPLFLYSPIRVQSDKDGEELAIPVARLLAECVESFAPAAEESRILKDNLALLEQRLRERLRDVDFPVDAVSALSETADEMAQQLLLDVDDNNKLKSDIARLLAAVPEGGQILSYGMYPAIHLLIHIIRCRVRPRLASFKKQIGEYIKGLQRLLDIDREKSLEAIEPEKLEKSVGQGSSLIDPVALSEVMDHTQGSISMSSTRKQRVQETLSTLEAHQQEEVQIRFVHIGHMDESCLAGISGLEVTVADEPCIRATELFDKEADQLSKVFAAVRIAKLEIENNYDPAIHDPWFANFSWEAFSKEELLLVPTVIALESAPHVAGEAMPAFSQLLNSGRPVQILVRVLAHANPGQESEDSHFSTYRTELGYLAVSHRQAVVSQGSAARHEQLIRHFSTSLEATRTSLHLLNVGLRPTGQSAGLNAWLVAGAALEGRVHPFFHINPSLGDSFAERMEFKGNPQPEKDWPVNKLEYIDEQGEQTEMELPFTFADYALLIPRLHHHFAPVPLICESDDLVPLVEHLNAPTTLAEKQVPYIWAVNARGEMRQLTVSRTLVEACRDRLSFWHSLQEMAGVRNRYVELAVEETRREITAQMESEKEQLMQQHAKELDDARAEAAGEVMGRLANRLLGMDFTSSAAWMPMVDAKKPSSTIEEVTSDLEDEMDELEEALEEASFEDPWIDSPLCTSCNDCLAINPVMFVYNDSNQAIIADISAGTYAELVEAAEICPSRCIHPGKPLNTDEANLDELITRAAPFN